MSIQSASIPVGGTTSTTGGTATGLLVKRPGNPAVCILDDGSAFSSQTKLSFSTTEPKVNKDAPNGYTQARNSVYIQVPLALDNGNRTVNTVEIRIACDIETTDAEKAALRDLAVQFLNDADFQSFWDDQSVA